MSTTSASTTPRPDEAAARRDGARADLARFIAACYYEPDAAFEEERLFDSMARAAALIDPEIAAIAGGLGEAFRALPLQELTVDHARLFLGPVQALARPYASVWLSGENVLMQDSTLALQSLYQRGGFEIADDFRDLPDHIAAELEFLYLLIHRENAARWGGDDDERAHVSGLRRTFLDEHLGRWLGPFLLAMHEGAQSDFYERLAQLTEVFVRFEAQRG